MGLQRVGHDVATEQQQQIIRIDPTSFFVLLIGLPKRVTLLVWLILSFYWPAPPWEQATTQPWPRLCSVSADASPRAELKSCEETIQPAV